MFHALLLYIIFYYQGYLVSSFNKTDNINYNKVVVTHDLRRDGLSLGLTNQLSRVVQLIQYGCKHHTYVSQLSFRLDFALDIFGELEDVLDIDKTNQNYNCTKIIKTKHLTHFKHKQAILGHQLNQDVGSWNAELRKKSESIFQKLEFSHSFDTT